MREPADAEAIRRLAEELGRVAPEGTRLYLTGGATAVHEGWRDSTVDIDLLLEPDADAALRRLAELKEELNVNVELASPLDFLPELPGWRQRSRSRYRVGTVTVLDFDPYSQALSKLERGFDLDLADVDAMLADGLVEPRRLLELFEQIAEDLHRFPAVDAAGLRVRLEHLRDRPQGAGE